MCGIAVIFAYDSRAAVVDRTRLLRCAERMTCRGPDGHGLWVAKSERVALGHRRLAIIDPTDRGAQPMMTPDGATVVSFNGEIYNYREIRSRLEKKGYCFRTGTDTEVLLHLYADQGEAMVHELRGMFAFALWDERTHRLFIARDPFGIKPLYYADNGQVFCAASEVKALLAFGEIDTRPEPAGHVGFFLWGHVPEPYTLYKGIRSLPAGSTMWIGRQGPMPARSYADLTAVLAAAELGSPSGDLRETTEQLHAALLDSVRHHLVADVEVGVFLSSGLDSAIVTALATELGGHIRTVTLGFDEYRGGPADEIPTAKLIAQHYGTEEHVAWITREHFRTEFDRLLDRMDQPTIDGVNSYFVAQAASQLGLKVALSGLGGDELFAGYASFHQIARLVKGTGFIPGRRLLGRGFRVLSAPFLKRFTSPKFAGLLEYGGDFSGGYLLRRGLFLPWELPELLDGELVREGWNELQTMVRLDRTTEGISSNRLKVSALETTWYMRNQLLRDTDWTGMSHSLEIRVPLVDWTLWQTVAPLISAQPSLGKRAMAQSPRKPLPAVVIDRPKTGFNVPTNIWLEPRRGQRHLQRGMRGWAKHVYDSISVTASS
jgi:asparagine synthase (glutamine-hydrolysing)